MRRRRRRATFETLETRNLLSGSTVVTSTADSGPGSLRQAIENADAQPGTDPIEISFDLATDDPGYDASTGDWTISVQSELPAITRAGITLDGATQPAAVNASAIGTGGTVGANQTPLTQWSGIWVQIVDGSTYGVLPVGLDIQAGDTTIVGLAISGFGDPAGDTYSANILVDTTQSGTWIADDLIGVTATGQAPSALQISPGNNVSIVQSGPGTIENSLIADGQGDGVDLSNGSNHWDIQGNEIRGNGLGNANLDGINIGRNTGNESIIANLIVANWANGIDSLQSTGGNLVFEDTIAGNGVGTLANTADAGIRLSGELSLVKSNVINGNFGAGVQVTPAATGNTISQNSIDDNGAVTNLAGDAPTGELGIDVQVSGDNLVDGTAAFVTPNDPGASRDGIDGPTNFPVFSSLEIENGQLTISGYARPGSTIELYLADPGPTGFGQGQTYLASFVTGSSSDLGVGTGSYGPYLNGIYIGQDSTNVFKFTIPTPLGVGSGSILTATATLNGSTSEFGPGASVTGTAGPLIYQAPASGPDAITVRDEDSDVEVVDNGSVVASEPLSLTTSLSILGDPGGLDQFTVDDSSGDSFFIPGGISIQGGGKNSSLLNIVGDGQVGGSYLPNATTTGSGQVNLTSLSVQFSDLGSLSLSSLSALTFVAPGAGDILGVDSPAFGENEIDGYSGGLAFTPATFSLISDVAVNTAINDAVGTTDWIVIGQSGLNASGLANFAIEIGSANQELSVLSSNLKLPVAGGSYTDDGGSGLNSLIATADVDYTLNASSLSIPGQGSIALSNVQDVQLTGGPDSTQFIVNDWGGGLLLDGGPGVNSLSVVESGSYSGDLSLSDFASTFLQIQGNFSGQITAPPASTIQSIQIGGNLLAGSSIVAGSFVAPSSSSSPAIVVGGDDGGTITAVQDTATPGSGILSSLQIDGSLLASTGMIGASSIGTLEITGDLSGLVEAKGVGTIGTVTVGGNLTGTVDVPEDSNPGSGTISSLNVTGSLTGTVSSGTISNIYVGGDLAGTIIAQGAGTIGTVTVGGNLSGTVDAPEDTHPGSGTISSVSVTGSLTGTVSSGTISNIYVGGDLAGTIIAQGAGTIGTVTVGGNLSGTVDAPEDTHPGSGTISSVSVTGSLTGTVSSGTISNIYVGGDLAGTIIAQGAGTIGTVTVGGNLSGTVDAPEDTHPGSGTISSVSITGSLTGTVSSGTISNIYVGGDLAGTIIAQGAGTIGTVTVGGNLSGTVDAPEDTHPGSGTISSVSVTGSLTGTVSSGTISNIYVGGDLAGTIIAQGAGKIGTVSVVGNLSGTLNAALDSHSTSGEISSLSVTGVVTGLVEAARQLGSGSLNAIGASGSIELGDITTSLTVAASTGTIVAGNVAQFVGLNNIGGNVSFQGLSNLSVGDLSGALDYKASTGPGSISIGVISTSGSLSGSSTAGGVSIGTLQGRVELGNAGTVEYASLAPGSELDASSINSLIIDQNSAGSINVTGDLHQLSIPDGSLLAGAVIEAGSLDEASIGLDMAGRITVAGTLGQLNVGGATSGSVVAANIGTISAGAGTGPFILQVEENGIERNLVASTLSDPFPQPTDSPKGTLAQVSFRYLYESGGLTNPQLTVQVSNDSGSNAPNQFDLSLVTDNDAAKFNLSRLDANGVSGIGNVTVEGDILTSVSSQTAAFFAGDTNPAGVRLPMDRLAGVEVRDFIPGGGYVQATSIQAIAAGQFGLANGQTVMGAVSSSSEASQALAPGTAIVQASGTFRVPFADQSNLQVGFFLDDSTSGEFDPDQVAFTVQSVVTANAAGTSNIITQSNVERGADVALIQVAEPATASHGGTVIQSINIMGDGASITTSQLVSGSINSSGTLGDVRLLNSQPVGSITAASIFGTITSSGPITGTIQTTGLWTDPITGGISSTEGDFGRKYLNGSNQLTTTQFVVGGGVYTGSLIVRGNLLSSIDLNDGFTGTIATQGNIGSGLGASTLGGITVNGNDGGRIVSLGQILGVVTLNGSLNTGGYIAAETDILGSTTISGNVDSGANIMSTGVIGFGTLNTVLTINGKLKGLVAADEAVNVSGNQSSDSHIFSSAAGTPNEAAIDAIFATDSTDLQLRNSLDSAPGTLDLQGLDAILTNLANLHIARDGKLSDTPGT